MHAQLTGWCAIALKTGHQIFAAPAPAGQFAALQGSGESIGVTLRCCNSSAAAHDGFANRKTAHLQLKAAANRFNFRKLRHLISGWVELGLSEIVGVDTAVNAREAVVVDLLEAHHNRITDA